MADKVREIYVDLTTDPARFVVGDLSGGQSVFPPPYHQDTLGINWRFVKILGNSNSFSPVTPYSLVDLTGAALTVKLWNITGATVLASQTSWTLDSTGKILAEKIALYTANMIDAMTTVAVTAYLTCILEVTLTLGDGQVYTFRDNGFRVGKSLNIPGSPVVTAADTYNTTVQSDARYVRRDGGNPGDGYYLISASGKKIFKYLADLADGGVEERSEQVT